jgi:molybdopterin-guanine dinucleotide biosynthesis protein
MIVPIIGPPGAGKTTLLREITRRYGTPHFELSWMPEFLTMNGVKIAYPHDESIAIKALIAVAREYVKGGHRVVFVSDFRIETLESVLAQLSTDFHQTIKLICTDDDKLKQRVLDSERPSGYRNVDESLEANKRYIAMELPDCCVIDVATTSINDAVEIVEKNILAPNKAVQRSGPSAL